MLDLAKPLGPVEGLTLYGDHIAGDLVYYLPDEVRLAMDGDRPAMSLQIYFPDEAIAGGTSDLAASVGALLGVGVTCTVDATRLENAEQELRERLGLEQVRLAPPPWEDGRVDLVLLDASTAAGISDDAMVSAVIGSRRPSLQDLQLAGLFHARLDRRGAALVDAALRGGLGTVAGVLYDLQFSALRPALDMRIHADLDLCADFVRATLGVSAVYVGAELGFVLDKMVQDGVIDVEVLSQLDTPEAQRAADEVVKDFQDTVMRELFRPTVAPLAGLATTGTAAPQGSVVRLSATWGHSEHKREITVDYSKRQATRRTHNPQRHLYGMAAAAAAPERFIQRVPLGSAWRERSLEIAAPQAFDDALLRELSAVVWRGRDAVLPPEQARDGGLRMPESAVALVELAFTAAQPAPRRVAWVSDPDEPPFYRWQARATWAAADDVDSPPALWSEPRTSTSQDLDLFPSLLIPTRSARFSLADGLPADLAMVVVHLTARDRDGTEVATHSLTLSNHDAARRSGRWGLRRTSVAELTLDAALTFHFDDGRRLEVPARRVIDRDVTILSPFVATRAIGVIVAGATPSIDRITLVLRYHDEARGYTHEVTRALLPPAFRTDDIAIPVLTPDADVAWEAERFDRDRAEPQRLGGGRTTRSLVIPAQGAGRTVRLTWVGPDLADTELTRLTVRVRVRADSGEEVEREEVTYRAGDDLSPRVLALAGAGTLEVAIERRFRDGTSAREPFRRIEAGEVLITP
jgi:hypothetical protein